MNTLGVGVIGAGYWGPNLIRTFDGLPDCRVLWVCEKKPGRQRYVKEKWPHLPVTADVSDVLQDPAVDAVVIATSVSTHYDLAVAALEAGKHVLVEKPLAATAGEAERIVELAQRRRLVAATGHIFVYHPAVTEMKRRADAGAIGPLCYAESGRVNLGPPASEVDVIWDLAVHDVSILVFLKGAAPAAVTAFGGRYHHEALLDVAFLNVEFDDGSMAQHHVSWLSPQKVRRFFVAGAAGSMVFDDTAATDKLKIVDLGVDSRRDQKDDDAKELFYRPGEVVAPPLPAAEPLRVECAHFLDCVRTGRAPLADALAGLSVVRVLEAAEQSIAYASRRVTLAGAGR